MLNMVYTIQNIAKDINVQNQANCVIRLYVNVPQCPSTWLNGGGSRCAQTTPICDHNIQRNTTVWVVGEIASVWQRQKRNNN